MNSKFLVQFRWVIIGFKDNELLLINNGIVNVVWGCTFTFVGWLKWWKNGKKSLFFWRKCFLKDFREFFSWEEKFCLKTQIFLPKIQFHLCLKLIKKRKNVIDSNADRSGASILRKTVVTRDIDFFFFGPINCETSKINYRNKLEFTNKLCNDFQFPASSIFFHS